MSEVFVTLPMSLVGRGRAKFETYLPGGSKEAAGVDHVEIVEITGVAEREFDGGERSGTGAKLGRRRTNGGDPTLPRSLIRTSQTKTHPPALKRLVPSGAESTPPDAAPRPTVYDVRLV
jgi:hypothetical protein